MLCSRCETILKETDTDSLCSKCLKSFKNIYKNSKFHRKKGNKGEIHTYLWKHAELRAKLKDIPIQRHTVDIPDYCPILGIKLAVSDRVVADNSYSFDKIIPELGYVPGNVICISQRANRIKNNATISELEKITNFYKDILS